MIEFSFFPVTFGRQTEILEERDARSSKDKSRGTKFPKARSSINGRFFDLARDFVNVLTTFSGPAFPSLRRPF